MADKNEILWQLGLDHRVAGRHHESLRDSTTGLAVGLASAIIAFSFSDLRIDASEIAFGILTFLIGFFGLLLAMKHYERFENHYDKYDCIKIHLGKVFQIDIGEIEKGCKEKKENWIKRTRLGNLWNSIHIIIIAIGLGLIIAA